MNNHYLVEITMRQTFFVAVEAISTSHAIHKAVNQDGEVSQPYPPETEEISAKVIRGEHGEA